MIKNMKNIKTRPMMWVSLTMEGNKPKKMRMLLTFIPNWMLGDVEKGLG